MSEQIAALRDEFQQKLPELEKQGITSFVLFSDKNLNSYYGGMGEENDIAEMFAVLMYKQPKFIELIARAMSLCEQAKASKIVVTSKMPKNGN